MNRRMLNTTNMLGGAHRFCLDHPLVPPVVKATQLITEVGTSYTTMLSLGSAQSGGTADWQNGTDQRSVAARALRDKLRELVDTARSLDAPYAFCINPGEITNAGPRVMSHIHPEPGPLECRNV